MRLPSAAPVCLGGYFCSRMADPLAGFFFFSGCEKSFRSKKAFFIHFEQSMAESSKFAQSERSGLQFSGLLTVMIPGTQAS